MRTLVIIAAALALSACVSPGAVTGGPATASAEALPALKEVNRHLELCHRTYAWPFSAVIDCPAQPAAPGADVIGDLIDKAVAKALAAAGRAPPTAKEQP